MTGCLLLLPFVALVTFMGAYMTSLMAFFGVLGAGMSVVMAGMASFFTAFFIIMFG